MIRHAEATHNQRFREAAEQPERHDELKAAGYNVEDSPLTAAGVAQAPAPGAACADARFLAKHFFPVTCTQCCCF